MSKYSREDCTNWLTVGVNIGDGSSLVIVEGIFDLWCLCQCVDCTNNTICDLSDCEAICWDIVQVLEE